VIILLNFKKTLHSDVFLFVCCFLVGLAGYFFYQNSKVAPLSVNGDYNSYFDENSISPIIYTKESCRYCISLKGYLSENKIGFVERNIENDTLFETEFKKLGGYGTPLVLFRDQLIVGFRQDLIVEKIANTKLEAPQ